MQNVAAKSGAQFSLIPPIPSEVSGDSHAESNEIEANKGFAEETEKSNEIGGVDHS